MGTATRGKWRGVTNAALGAIVAHPVRCRLLTVFAERPASPAELAQELGVPVGDVSYHVRTLKDAGVIQLVDERPVRGSTEHFYEARAKPLLTDTDYKEMSVEERIGFARTIFQIAAADASVSFESGKFGERHDHHVSRVPFSVDETGWKELVKLFADTLGRALEIQADCEARRAESGGTSIYGTAFMSFFETAIRNNGPKT